MGRAKRKGERGAGEERCSGQQRRGTREEKEESRIPTAAASVRTERQTRLASRYILRSTTRMVYDVGGMPVNALEGRQELRHCTEKGITKVK
jgi:hypothetical protein